MNPVKHADMADFLASLEAESVDHILTSPPFIGLPGRANTYELVDTLLAQAVRLLRPLGTITLIVGAAPGHPLLPFEVAHSIPHASSGRIALRGLYVWDRAGTLNRDVDGQNVTHDVILRASRVDSENAIRPLSEQSVIKTSQHGYNYGTGISTPPDLAAFLVEAVSNPGELIVDPLCGLGEIGVQALHQGRRFTGCDNSIELVTIANARLSEHLPVPA